MTKISLGTEVRQSLSLIAMTATSMVVYLCLGLVAVRLFG
jgi:hypothetical protein